MDNEEVKKTRKQKNNSHVGLVLMVSILLSFICGMFGAYLISKTVSVESVVKHVTTSELVENSISSSVDKVYNSTLYIACGSKSGTGFIYKIANGKAFVLTNYHVIEGGDKIQVEFNDSNKTIEATLLDGDKYADVAVLTIPDDGYTAVQIGENEKLKLGDTVFTVGAPMGKEYKGTVTKGILSGKERMVTVEDNYLRLIQIDAAINHGNSGGPVCDVSGNVIGITSVKIVEAESGVEGMGFAIPIEDALAYAEKFEKGEKIVRPYLGVGMADLDQEFLLWQNRIIIPEEVDEGVVVVSIEAGSPADKAGFKKGDIIIQIGEKDAKSLKDFRYELYKYEVGESVNIKYLRNGKVNTAKVTLGRNPSQQ